VRCSSRWYVKPKHAANTGTTDAAEVLPDCVGLMIGSGGTGSNVYAASDWICGQSLQRYSRDSEGPWRKARSRRSHDKSATFLARSSSHPKGQSIQSTPITSLRHALKAPPELKAIDFVVKNSLSVWVKSGSQDPKGNRKGLEP
jgi:hypothetical protein